ncbi:unnamed protein product [Ranitomeya imitator]|uniref:Testis expressed 2 n=1 Tax=Ranitomeya imitator TaxID=111125 RepID=A0ABN9M5D4_9NEOB|nr:unnamed protein product [Ranitomeya imitator]
MVYSAFIIFLPLSDWQSSFFLLNHAKPLPRPPPPKVEVHRSVSQETLTIRFSAFGTEEEEEEETLSEDMDDQKVVTAVEASEDLYFDSAAHVTSSPAASPADAMLQFSLPTLLPTAMPPTEAPVHTTAGGNGGDSKTAPSSPITSPSDGRSFFKVTEVEAKIEDTKRRFSEVIYEPFQLLSKIMGDESSSYRSKALSSSASELSSLSNLNGHLEANNNNYSIKEEDGDDECTTGQEKEAGSRGPALALDSCSLSALVSKEDEEFTELYSEDFDFEDEEAVEAPEEAAGVCGTADDEGDEYVEAPEVPALALFLLVLAVYAYLLLPLPSYLEGLCLGMAVGFMAAIAIIWLFASPRSSRGRLFRRETPAEPLSIAEPDIWKSVYVRLEGAMLRLSKPNKNVSRRATFNEAKPDVTYISQKIYDLTDCKVHLVPHSLARKRLWNKKYPICLELGRQEDFMSKAQREKETTDEDKEETLAEGGSQQDGGKSSTGRNTMGGRDQVLYLFGRTGREKEEWFHRLLLASRMKSDMKKALRSVDTEIYFTLIGPQDLTAARTQPAGQPVRDPHPQPQQQ